MRQPRIDLRRTLVLVLLLAQSTWSWMMRPSGRCRQKLGAVPALSARTDSSSASAQTSSTADDRDALVAQVLELARELGPVGSYRTEQEQQELLDLAKKLGSYSAAKPARAMLDGVHSLIYSAAPGGSSGKLLGPVYGKVQQEFVDGITFINSVKLGPLRIALTAERKIMNDTRIKVTFKQTKVSLFGKTMLDKEITGGGVWDCIFTGQVTDQGQEKLIRVMETPSLFVIEQAL